MKPQLKDEVITSIDDHRTNRQRTLADEVSPTPANLDELTHLARKMLMEAPLEVSKVKPLFWSMVETYVDRFEDFPFDCTKAMQSYLELNDYPADQMRELVAQLEAMYEQKHGEPMRSSTGVSGSSLSLDEEMEELRGCLKYAGIVGEIEGG